MIESRGKRLDKGLFKNKIPLDGALSIGRVLETRGRERVETKSYDWAGPTN